MEKVPKIYKEYYCKYCNYKCSNKTNFEKHLLSKKHQKKEIEIKQEKPDGKYICKCGKLYKHNQSLYRHQLTCKFVQNKDTENNIISHTDNSQNSLIITELLKELKEKDKTIKDMIPKIGNNNNNKQFNINIFLNEDCKDAINMSDFIKSIKVSAEQLEYTTKNGLQKGLTNVILENINKLSLNERPVHCTDTRRDTMYIKDNNVWEKDNDKSKIKEAINKVSGKNYSALSDWSKDNPDFMENENKQEYYTKTITTIGKKVDESKIIKDVSKDTYLNTKN
tara:strand:+ start:711 stop:1550 length:840 start_codon:yes stop_codon:yes gene_type:complete